MNPTNLAAVCCLLAAMGAVVPGAATTAPSLEHEAMRMMPHVEILDPDTGATMPQVSSGRQLVLNSIIRMARTEIHADPSLAETLPTLGAIVDAHDQYVEEMVASRRRRRDDGNMGFVDMTPEDGNSNSETEMAVYESVLAHAATPEGKQMVTNLHASDLDFQSADAAAAVNRQEECAQLRGPLLAQGSENMISEETKQCMCDPSQPYTLCRMLLANDMHTSTLGIDSTATDADVAAIANATVPDSPRTNNTMDQPMRSGAAFRRRATMHADSDNAHVSRRAAAHAQMKSRRGFVPYNPHTGEIGVEACLGEGTEMCIKGTGTLPTYRNVHDAEVELIETCKGGECSKTPAETFGAVVSNQLAQAGIEVGVSLCLGIPGLTQVLNKFGISLCYNFLSLGLYPLQGPLGQASTGLQLFVVKLSAWVRVKMSDSSPVCPQDWNEQMRSYACAHPKTYQAYVDAFGNTDFCNMHAGQAVVGASVTVDVFFYTKQWNFAKTPAPRPVPVCPGTTGLPGAPSDFTMFDCPNAQAAYLQYYPDVARSVYGNTNGGARTHWEIYGKNEGRVWPGQTCITKIPEPIYCYAARQLYYAQNQDVYKHPVFNPSHDIRGAYSHWIQYGRAEGRAWASQLCIQDNLTCPAAEQKYLAYYNDVAQHSYFGSHPREHYVSYGKKDMRVWPGHLCNVDTDCPAAEAWYLSTYADVAQARLGAWYHYQTYGKGEGRQWNGAVC